MKTTEGTNYLYLEGALKRQLETEVSNYLYDLVEDRVNKMINEFAVNAVKNWSTQVKSQEDFRTKEISIEVNFIENIIKTVMKENDISITVNKNDV